MITEAILHLIMIALLAGMIACSGVLIYGAALLVVANHAAAIVAVPTAFICWGTVATIDLDA